jgi:AGCS family alanine or glycine:cation symporter
VYILFVFLGTSVSLDIVWNLADTLNALMALPNIVAVLLLSKVIVDETNKYLKHGDIMDKDNDEIPLHHDLLDARKAGKK